jgi:Na+-translocating ferredoxin:NAD+ oxidoreductase RnfE subunit
LWRILRAPISLFVIVVVVIIILVMQALQTSDLRISLGIFTATSFQTSPKRPVPDWN